MRHLALLAFFAAPLALAGDDINLDDIDIDLDDIDIGGGGGGESISYDGGITQRAEDIPAGAALSIKHAGGDITVNCTDNDNISARVDYQLEGSDRDRLEAYGKGIRLKAWGGGVSVTTPAKPSSVTRADVPLMVSVPQNAKLNVSATGGTVSVTNCALDVVVSAKGGVYVEGAYESFRVSSSTGDVKVELEAGAVITKASTITSTSGNATLIMPDNPNNQLVATGNEVAVAPLVTGKNTPTSVIGELGTGGAKITLTAPKGKVSLEVR